MTVTKKAKQVNFIFISFSLSIYNVHILVNNQIKNEEKIVYCQLLLEKKKHKFIYSLYKTLCKAWRILKKNTSFPLSVRWTPSLKWQ